MLAVHQPAHLAHLLGHLAPAVAEGAVSDMAARPAEGVAVAMAGETGLVLHQKKIHFARRKDAAPTSIKKAEGSATLKTQKCHLGSL